MFLDLASSVDAHNMLASVPRDYRRSKMSTFSALTRLRIGRGGKMDDTSCVVAEIIGWTVSLTHSH